MTTLALLREYLTLFFVRHTPEKLLELLTEDIHSYGFAEGVEIEGIEAAKALLSNKKYLLFMAYELGFVREKQITDESAMIVYSLTHGGVTVKYRLMGHSRVTDAGRRLFFLNSCMVDPRQTLTMFADLAKIRREEKARDILKTAMPGGAMGGYLAPGYPFYFINDNMLCYLGYDSEAEFVRDIGGLVNNCIHPEDVAKVDEAVRSQLAQAGSYTVEYRMRKRDGGYIWVHDTGKTVTAEDGRTAILSACYDVTAEKEHERFLDGLVHHLNGDLSTLAVDLKAHRTYPVFVSDEMGGKQGFTREEYLQKYGQDGMESIYEGDRARVWAAMEDAVLRDKAPSISFRILTTAGKTRWMNASFSRYGEHDGLPVILVLFTASTVQNELQMHALNENGLGIALIDADTHEAYYVNDTMFHMLGLPVADYTGRTCPELLRGCGGDCARCELEQASRAASLDKTFLLNSKWISAHAERHIWDGKNVVNIFLRDVTQRHLLQLKVEESNREMGCLMSNLSCGVCVCTCGADRAFTVKYLSDGFCKIFEGEPRELIDRYAQDPCAGVAPEDQAAARAFVQKCMQGSGNEALTYRYLTRGGTEKYLTLKATVVPDGAGGLTSYATYFDVTEQMRIRHRLDDVLHNAPGGVCMYSWDGHALSAVVVSGQVASLFGCGEDREALARATLDGGLVHKEDLPGLVETLRAGLACPEKQQTYAYRIWNERAQCYRWISAAAACVPQADGTLLVYVTFTDVNAFKDLEQRLRQEEALLHAACESAQVWTWVYDIPTDSIRTSEGLQRDFGLPEVLMNYSTSWPDLKFVLPESAEQYRQKVMEIKSGADHVAFEARVRNVQGVEHWYRIRFTRFAADPTKAICIGQIIDDEIILRARVDLEKQKMLSSDRTMVGYIVTDITEDRVVESEVARQKAPLASAGTTLEEGTQTALQHVAAADRERYGSLHDRAMLLEAYSHGRTSFEFVGVCTPDGEQLAWVRCVLNLVKHPATGSIYLYEYIFDVQEQKLTEEITAAVARYDYERVASVDLKTAQMTVIDLDRAEAGERVQVWAYPKRSQDYGAAVVVPADREAFLRRISLDTVRQQLRDKESYEFVHHVVEADGTVGCRRTRFSYYNRDMGLCLMTRADVTRVTRDEEQRAEQLAHALRQAREALLAKAALEQDRELLTAALFSIVPMVISANITRGSFVMLNYDTFTTKKAPRSGTYEELIDVGVSTVPQDQQALFRRTFEKENILREYAAGKGSILLVHQQLGDDGILRWIETRCVFVKDAHSGELHTITLAQDVTERRQGRLKLEKALETAENATQAKSEFLSRMSHEIRTPMNAIMGMTAIAKENRTDFRQVAECLDKIDLSSRFLLTLINDILEMSRIESGRTEIRHAPFDFETLMTSIRTVVEPLAIKGGVRYDFVNNAQTEACYLGDAMRIQQVVVNIISNAIKFTKPGGRVRFSVGMDSQTQERTLFRFVVADTGIGMSEAFMQRMFQPFTQEDGSNTSVFGGSGLGLAISKSLCETMGGAISAESFQGIGSTFTVTLPLDRVSGAAQKTIVPEEAVETDLHILHGCRVLMAEDHPLNVMVARKILEQRGVSVTVAGNGQLAVEAFQGAEAGSFDAILMDIRMPVMDGWDAAKAIRALDRPDARTIPIIAMTANALDEDREHSRSVGMNEHLAKPFEPITLYTVLAAQIEKARAGRTERQ